MIVKYLSTELKTGRS